MNVAVAKNQVRGNATVKIQQFYRGCGARVRVTRLRALRRKRVLVGIDARRSEEVKGWLARATVASNCIRKNVRVWILLRFLFQRAENKATRLLHAMAYKTFLKFLYRRFALEAKLAYCRGGEVRWVAADIVARWVRCVWSVRRVRTLRVARHRYRAARCVQSAFRQHTNRCIATRETFHRSVRRLQHVWRGRRVRERRRVDHMVARFVDELTAHRRFAPMLRNMSRLYIQLTSASGCLEEDPEMTARAGSYRLSKRRREGEMAFFRQILVSVLHDRLVSVVGKEIRRQAHLYTGTQDEAEAMMAFSSPVALS